MANDRNMDRLSSRSDTPRAVEDLATTALTRVATFRVHTDPACPNPKVSRRLLDSIMSRSSEPHRAVVAGMLKAGVTPEAIADIYIPEVARLMGGEWETDVSNFALVTLGSVRLQTLLRDLDEIWDTGHSGIGKDSRPLVRIVTLAQSQHTLGASVLATQLRRLGCSVRVQAGRSGAECDDVRETADRCDAVFVSASRSDKVRDVARMVARLRSEIGDAPIVLGGTLLDVEPDVPTVTGVDYIARDPVGALEVCGIAPMWTKPSKS